MVRRRFQPAVLALMMMVGLLLVPGSAGAVVEVAGAELPRPSGAFGVGVRTLHLRDDARADPWVPVERRELMVSLWYPTILPIGRYEPYVTRAESALMVAWLNRPDLSADLWTTVGTHARREAPPLPRRRPLVVLSPGFTLPRQTLTSLAEDLASRGYVVAAVGHNYESIATSFPDGRTTACVACSIRDGVRTSLGRAADVSFVLDQLMAGRRAGAVAGVPIDKDRIAMVGHSIGGSATLAAMAADPRIDAGINLDGPFFVPAGKLDRPFMMVGTDDRRPGGKDPNWDARWSELSGWKRWFTVAGAGHNFATDLPLLGTRFGIELPDPQSMSGERGIRIARTYVVAFLDRHLLGRPQRLLDRGSPSYPEVRRWEARRSSSR